MMPYIMLRQLLLRVVIALVPGLGIAAAAPATTLTEGVEYARLVTPEPVHDQGKIEVLEVFNYTCVHCFDLQPVVRAWQQHLPTDVDFQLLPAAFAPQFELYARGFFAAEALGKLAATHEGVFDALWNRRVAVRSLGDLATLYAGLGVDRESFIEAAQSSANRAAVDAAKEKIHRLKVSGTPEFYVAGRYRVLGTLITTQEELLQRVDAVVAMERAARARLRAPAR